LQFEQNLFIASVVGTGLLVLLSCASCLPPVIRKGEKVLGKVALATRLTMSFLVVLYPIVGTSRLLHTTTLTHSAIVCSSTSRVLTKDGSGEKLCRARTLLVAC
jgi:hypothetical protein